MILPILRNGSIIHVSMEGRALRSDVLLKLLVNPINCRGMCVCTIQFICTPRRTPPRWGGPRLTAACAACASGECETLPEAARVCAPDAYVYNNAVY